MHSNTGALVLYIILLQILSAMRFASKAASLLVLLSLFLANCDRIVAQCEHLAGDESAWNDWMMDNPVLLQSLNAIVHKPLEAKPKEPVLIRSDFPVHCIIREQMLSLAGNHSYRSITPSGYIPSYRLHCAPVVLFSMLLI